jgi:acyl CoA:acetate/3-ketoacid CoA transferase alpha subunit
MRLSGILKMARPLMLGGFGLCGLPENCIAALVKEKANGANMHI